MVAVRAMLYWLRAPSGPRRAYRELTGSPQIDIRSKRSLDSPGKWNMLARAIARVLKPA